MAAAINGSTIHAAADLPKPGEDEERKLGQSDVEHLFIRNQSLRFVLVDEISMVSNILLGDFEYQMSKAARDTRYKKRPDKTHRIFGGYNILFF